MGDHTLVPALPVTPPAEGEVDIKSDSQHQLLVTPLTITPSQTPSEEITPDADDIMAGKKIPSLEQPDDAARELAKKLSLEEQVYC
jgi:hypothetical protein